MNYNKKKEYLDLDGAGIIYPYVASKKWNNIYRVEAKLKNEVVVSAVKEAVKVMEKRHPYFFMHIEKADRKLVLVKSSTDNEIKENAALCRPFELFNKGKLIRFVYTKDTLGIEFFHCLTDGHGSQAFFAEFLKEYVKLVSANVKAEDDSDIKKEDNLSDMFSELYHNEGGKEVSRFMGSCFQFPKQKEQPLAANSIYMNSADLKSAAKQYGVSISVYICAVQIASLIKTYNVKKKIRISIPVDLRRFFKSESCRNASLYFFVVVKPDKIKNFEMLIQTVAEQFKENLTEESLRDLSYTNVKTAELKIYKIIPIWLKKIVMNIGYYLFGEKQFTTALTNLGIINFDDEVNKEVSNAYFILGKQKTKPVNTAVSTFNGMTNMIISHVHETEKFISNIRSMLKKDGVETDIISFQ